MREIKLTRDKVALVDDDDFDLLNAFSWYCAAHGYAARGPSRKHVYMHRFIANPESGFGVDHINGNKLDNRRCNLRVGEHWKNICNSGKAQTREFTSKYKGVHWDSDRSRWRVIIKHKEKLVFCARFDSELAAARAYDKFMLTHTNGHARLNGV